MSEPIEESGNSYKWREKAGSSNVCAGRWNAELWIGFRLGCEWPTNVWPYIFVGLFLTRIELQIRSSICFHKKREVFVKGWSKCCFYTIILREHYLKWVSKAKVLVAKLRRLPMRIAHSVLFLSPLLQQCFDTFVRYSWYFCAVGITADLFARVAMPNFHGLWTFHIWTYEGFIGFGL